MLSLFYRRLVFHYLVTTFRLSSVCYDVVLFVVLLRRFICVGAIDFVTRNLVLGLYSTRMVTMKLL